MAYTGLASFALVAVIFAEMLVAQAVTGHVPGFEVLDQDVTPGGKLVCKLQITLLSETQESRKRPCEGPAAFRYSTNWRMPAADRRSKSMRV